MDQGIFETLPDAVIVVRGGSIDAANDAAHALFGPELVGRALDEVLAEGERRRLELLVAQRARGWPIAASCRLKFVRGPERGEITADVRFAERAGALILSARDVTDVTRAEHLMGKLAEIFTRGGALLGTDHLFDETTPVFLALGWVVAFTEISGSKRSVTRRVIAAPGDPVGAYGKTIIGVELPFDKTPVLAEVVRTGRPVFLDNLPTLQAGPARAATALGESMERAQVIRSAWCPIITNGKLTHLLAVTGRDLTEHDFVAVQLFAAQIGAAIHMRALRNALVHKERLAAVGQMAAVMAHEVRNPLGTIFNAVASLRRVDANDASTSKMPPLLDILQEEADRLQRLVADLLDFSRPSVVELASLDLRPVLEHAIEAARLDPALGGKALAVELEIADKLPPIESDARLLHRALVNLLVNALQNVEPNGKVSLRASVERDAVCIAVYNDGARVAPDLAERLFEPFFTTRATGTGLGLAVVRRVAEDLGGSVRLELGEPGTTFCLTLPVSPSSVLRGRPA